MQKVELHTAYVWDCEACGRENFCRSVVVEFSEEDRLEMAKEHGVEFETGEWVQRPDEVICQHCGAEFETEDIHQDDDDDDA